MFDKVKNWFSPAARNQRLQEQLDRLRSQAPVPVFWLFGKTQSGKTSIIKYLTGAEEAEIGQGFRPCTRFSRQYLFPTQEAPLLTFQDTPGLGDPAYDPREDLAQFTAQTHAMLVTVKALDHAQEIVLKHLRVLRQAQRSRPVVLILTCLHEAYPQEQHPQPDPFDQLPAHPGDFLTTLATSAVHPDLARSLAEQVRRFDGLVDRVVLIDLTRPEEGFQQPHVGGERLKQTLLDLLPETFRQTLLNLDAATASLQDLYARQALPYIVGYSTLAGTAGAVPIPWLDLLVLPGIQTQMIFHLARLYGQPLTGTRFLELASTLGLGMLVRQATREVVKLVPGVGSVAGALLASSSTFALGKAFCFYYQAVHKGHVPRPEELRRYYKEQLALAERQWARSRAAAAGDPGGAS